MYIKKDYSLRTYVKGIPMIAVRPTKLIYVLGGNHFFVTQPLSMHKESRILQRGVTKVTVVTFA